MRGMGLRKAVMGLSCFWNSGYQYMELGIFANATVPWLEGKEANKPRIRVEK